MTSLDFKQGDNTIQNTEKNENENKIKKNHILKQYIQIFFFIPVVLKSSHYTATKKNKNKIKKNLFLTSIFCLIFQ